MIKKITKLFISIFSVTFLYNCSYDTSYNIYKQIEKDKNKQIEKDKNEQILKSYKNSVTAVLTNIGKTSLSVGHKIQVSATVIHYDLSKNSAVNWSSSDNTIAVVDQNGNISAVKEGETTIVVSSTENKEIITKILVVVKKQEYEEALVNIDIKEATIKVGEKIKLTANVLLSNGAISPNIIWSSEDESIAEVSQNGIVLTKKTGETKIFATAEGNQSKNAYTKIYVK